MGLRIATLVNKGGRIGLFIATPGQSNIQPRIDGAQAALKGKGYKIDVITTGADVPGELSKIDAYVQGHSDVKGLFAVDAGSTQGIGQTMKKHRLQAKGVKGGGYDLLPITLDLIKSGDLDFTIDQQPYLQGFQPVIQLFLYKISGGLMAPSNTNTGLLFVTKDNVDPYLSTKSRYEGSDKAAEVHQGLGSPPWRQPRRPSGGRRTAGRRIASHVIARREFGIFLVLVALILYFNARNSAFTSRGNWATLVEYGSPILIAAVGETMLLICGEIDLSVGHVYALAPLMLYQVAERGYGR